MLGDNVEMVVFMFIADCQDLDPLLSELTGIKSQMLSRDNETSLNVTQTTRRIAESKTVKLIYFIPSLFLFQTHGMHLQIHFTATVTF